MSGMHPMGGRWLRTDRSAVNARLTRKTLGRIGRFAVPHRAVIAAFLFVTVLDASIVVANPLIIKHLVDDGISKGDGGLVTLLAFAMVGVAVVDASFGVLMGWLSSRIGEGLIYDLRTKVFAHVQRMSLAFFTRTQTGALVSRLNNDVIGAQRAFTSVLSSVVSNSISVVVVGIAMFALSWQVTLLCLATFPILILASRWVGSRLAGLTRQQMDGNADLGNMMTERFNVGGALLLKLFGRRGEEDEKYGEKASVVRDLGVRISLISRVFGAAMMLVPALATALVYGVGGHLAIQQSLSVGTLIALATLLLRLLGPLQGLSNVRVDVMTALVSFDRVFEVLDLPSTVQEKPGASVLPAGAASVEFQRRRLRLPQGRGRLPGQPGDGEPQGEPRQRRRCSTASASGPSPARWWPWSVRPAPARPRSRTWWRGSTTSASGAVRVGGREESWDVRDVTLQSLEDSVGYVTQDAHMFHDTILENLRYARPGATEEQVWAALEAAQIAPLVRGLPDGLETVVGDRGYRLSGGERQRLAIARLLLKAPPIVVLDEATAHLDSESEHAVQRALDTALAGRTSLVIAHRLSTVRNADQILVVDAGRVVQQGTHLELLAEGGLYADLYRTQFVGDEAGEPVG